MSARRGILAFVLLLGAVGIAVMFAAFSLRRPVTLASSRSILVFDVPHQLDEIEPPLLPFSLDLARFGRRRPTVYTLVDGLRRAAEDDQVAGLVLHIGRIDWGWAKVAEVRDAVAAFQRAGKPVYASLTGGGEREYLLASVAETVSMPPTAMLQLDGLSISATFLKGTYDKLGVTPNFVHIGRFKSATESYTRRDFSEPAREALEAMLDDQYRLLIDSLSAARGVPPAPMRRLVEGGPYGTSDAVARGLIDSVLYDDEVDSLAVAGDQDEPSLMTLNRYVERLPKRHGGARIALVVAAGTIASGKSRMGAFEDPIVGSETLVEALRQARTRRSIKAIVLRIDSPGGDGQAADDIWRELERCRAAKPLIVSMSDYAASGGYYIAAPADSIVAQPSTLTGSIGVYGGKLNVRGLADKLGVSIETLSRGPHAGMFSPFRDFTPAEEAIFRDGLEEFYSGFVDRVAAGRHMPPEAVEEVAQGRVWTGLAASTRGLADALGGLDRAFEMARARASIPASQTLTIESFPRVERSFFARLLGNLLSGDEDEALGAAVLGPVLRAWIDAASFPAGARLALMPYSIDIR